MDITTVTDLTQLKAIAYDTMQAIEVQQNNLRIIQQRITELQQEQVPAAVAEDTAQPARKR